MTISWDSFVYQTRHDHVPLQTNNYLNHLHQLFPPPTHRSLHQQRWPYQLPVQLESFHYCSRGMRSIFRYYHHYHRFLLFCWSTNNNNNCSTFSVMWHQPHIPSWDIRIWRKSWSWRRGQCHFVDDACASRSDDFWCMMTKVFRTLFTTSTQLFGVDYDLHKVFSTQTY